MYIEPWHADVMEFLDLKKNHGKDELRARYVLSFLSHSSRPEIV